MTSNSNILKGIFLSLLVHAFVFAYLESSFSFNKSINASQNISKHVTVQLIKHLAPTSRKNLLDKNKSKPAVAKPEPPKKTLSAKNKPLQKPAAVSQIKKEVSVKPLDREPAKATPPPLADEKLNHQLNIELEKKKEKETYMQLLLAHIESYKFYPGAARRRAIEGKLDVSFLLSESGGHYQLEINGGKAVLQRAVRQALDDAQPFPKPPSSLLPNQPISFSMYYQLSDVN
ncbi:MAG: TonB family protein [Gammaproteobacteria bacterium]|nr:TonB family protein [Gammaproteobacteria bacterium]